ncbi:MAG TPA: response regulator, partial [bacterium]|nr:response regulator [bacterium]
MNAGGLGRILLVEDELDLREMVATRLRGSGYAVGEAGSIAAALELIRQLVPDLILLDVGLPDGSGFDLLESLRAEPGMPAVIFLTALGTPDNRLRGLYGGAVDFLVKPFDMGELVARVAAAMRQRRQLGLALAEAEHDGLTGLRNRRACESALQTELNRARRMQRVFALAYID